jgi:hypothetical protein
VTEPTATNETSSDFRQTITAHEAAQKSSEGNVEHSSHTAAKNAEAAKQPEERSWRDTFLDTIEQTKPLVSDRERRELDEARERQLDREERNQEAQDEADEAEQAALEAALENPLSLFEDESVKEWAEYLGVDEEALQNSTVQRMLAERMQAEADADQAAQQASQNVQASGQQGPQPTVEEYQGYIAQLDQLVDNPAVNDPQMMAAFTNSLAQYLGSDTPESQAAVTGLSRTLVQGGLSLVSTVVPMVMSHYLPQMIEEVLPGITEALSSASMENAWLDAKKELGPSLPDLGTAEWAEMHDAVTAKNPWFSSQVFKDASGRDLHPKDPRSLAQSARVLASLAMGTRVNPDTIAKAIATGRKEAESHNRRVSVSRATAPASRVADSPHQRQTTADLKTRSWLT